MNGEVGWLTDLLTRDSSQWLDRIKLIDRNKMIPASSSIKATMLSPQSLSWWQGFVLPNKKKPLLSNEAVEHLRVFVCVFVKWLRCKRRSDETSCCQVLFKFSGVTQHSFRLHTQF